MKIHSKNFLFWLGYTCTCMCCTLRISDLASKRMWIKCTHWIFWVSVPWSWFGLIPCCKVVSQWEEPEKSCVCVYMCVCVCDCWKAFISSCQCSSVGHVMTILDVHVLYMYLVGLVPLFTWFGGVGDDDSKGYRTCTCTCTCMWAC